MDISKAEETPMTSRPPISLTTAPEVDSINDSSVNQLYDDWLEFDAQLRVFEAKHKEYVRRLDDVESLKTKYRAEFDKYTKKIGQMKSELEQLKKIYGFPGTTCCTSLFLDLSRISRSHNVDHDLSSRE